MKTKIGEIQALILDFDGVLTDNTVYVDFNGNEFVRFNKKDSLAFDVMKEKGIFLCIVSGERSKIVEKRAEKLCIPAITGENDKEVKVKILSYKYGFDLDKSAYVGNDLNDYKAMLLFKNKFCPSDSHPKIKEISTVLSSPGGMGVIREIAEDYLEIMDDFHNS